MRVLVWLELDVNLIINSVILKHSVCVAYSLEQWIVWWSPHWLRVNTLMVEHSLINGAKCWSKEVAWPFSMYTSWQGDLSYRGQFYTYNWELSRKMRPQIDQIWSVEAEASFILHGIDSWTPYRRSSKYYFLQLLMLAWKLIRTDYMSTYNISFNLSIKIGSDEFGVTQLTYA